MNDDILVLYYYRDGLTDAERVRVQATLEEDANLRARYEELCSDMGAFDAAAKPAAVAPDIVARWHGSLERAARMEEQRMSPAKRVFHLPSFGWGAAMAATLALGIGIGTFFSGNDATNPTIDNGIVDTAIPEPATPSAAFARGLAVHLRESRQELAGLPAGADSERAMLITQMIQQNRMFERAAAQNDSQDLARVLRAFEPILQRLAADDISREDAEALQQQLAFELNVMLTKLGRNVSEETGPI